MDPDPYADRRAANAEMYALRDAEHAARREQASAEFAAAGCSLDPTGLPACDLCGALIAPSRVHLHRVRCA